MITQEIEQKLSDRFKNWQSKQIDLLTFSINVFFIISITFYGYFLDHKDLFCHKSVPFFPTYPLKYLIAFILPLSISLWIIILIVRLNDFRITKNITKNKKRVKKLQSNTDPIELDNRLLQIETLKKKIKNQKTVTKMLGRITWIFFYLQIFILIWIIWSVG